MQLVDFGATLVRARLAVLFGAALYPGGALFAKAVQGCAAVCFDENAGIDREPAVRVGQHVFGVTTLQQAPAHKTPVSVKTNLYPSYVATKGAQNASAQIGLHLGHSGLISSTGWVEDDDRRRGLGIGVARHFLKHAIDHTDVTTKLRRRLAQSCPVTPHEIAQPLRDGEHPLAQWPEAPASETAPWQTGSAVPAMAANPGNLGDPRNCLLVEVAEVSKLTLR